MTYLQIVNAVLLRLREDTVSSVASSTYSQLIGAFVNEGKRAVEDAWNWNALFTTISFSTASGTSNYTITGSGLRHKCATVNDTTNDIKLQPRPLKFILDSQQVYEQTNAHPVGYAWNGNDGTDSKMELYPTPDGIYALKVNLYVPQADLSGNSDVLTINSEAVVAYAFARALVERGEDAGLPSSEAFQIYTGILSDQIAIESSRYIENECWVAC